MLLIECICILKKKTISDGKSGNNFFTAKNKLINVPPMRNGVNLFLKKSPIKIQFREEFINQVSKKRKENEGVDKENTNVAPDFKKSKSHFENCTFNNCTFNFCKFEEQ